MEKQPKMVVVEDNIIFLTPKDKEALIREGMTLSEKISYLKEKFTSPYDDNRNLRRR